MEQIASVVGAIIILAAYGGAMAGWLDAARPLYGLMNLIGSGMLMWVAVVDRRAGFILLELAWAVISLAAVLRWTLKRRSG